MITINVERLEAEAEYLLDLLGLLNEYNYMETPTVEDAQLLAEDIEAAAERAGCRMNGPALVEVRELGRSAELGNYLRYAEQLVSLPDDKREYGWEAFAPTHDRMTKHLQYRVLEAVRALSGSGVADFGREVSA